MLYPGKEVRIVKHSAKGLKCRWTAFPMQNDPERQIKFHLFPKTFDDKNYDCDKTFRKSILKTVCQDDVSTFVPRHYHVEKDNDKKYLRRFPLDIGAVSVKKKVTKEIITF